MKVVLIGATGFVGRHILQELLSRSHTVTATARRIEGNLLQEPAGHTLQFIQADATDQTQLLPLLQGHDAVISAFNAGWTNPDLYEAFIQGSLSIQHTIEKSSLKRLIVIGGAGSLYTEKGQQLVDSPDFPKAFFAGASAARDYLNILRQNKILDWTFVSPAIEMNKTTSGLRKGHYRTDLEHPIFDKNGRSVLSVEDLSMAIVDELEKGAFIRKRFTAAY